MAIAALPPGAGWLYWYAATYRSPAYSRRMRTPKVPKCRVLSPIPPSAIAAAAEARRQPNAIHRYGPETSVLPSAVTWMPVYAPARTGGWVPEGRNDATCVDG